MKEDPLVAMLRATLEKCLDYVKAETPSEENVTQLRAAMASMEKAIATGL
jgi:hypothetical protein